MAARIQFKRGLAASWTSINPILYVGECGFETDTGKLKVGDGSTAWNSLNYFSGDLSGSDLADLGDVSGATPNTGNYLKWDGSSWGPSSITTANISDITATATEINYIDGVTSSVQTQLDSKAPLASPTFTGTVTLPNNTVTNAMLAGSIDNNKLSNSSITVGSTSISLGGTANSISGLTSISATTFTGSLSGNASTATALQTSRTISLGGDLSGSASFDGSANITITATIGSNSVALGTDTTGDYVASLVAGSGISVSNNTGEGATPTIANTGVISVNGSSGAITGVVTTADSGTVTSTMIADNTIVNADINSSAAIALSKLALGTSGQVVLANSSGVPTYTSLSGDVTISDTGVVAIQPNSVALGTDTTGNYVASLVAGTGVTLSNNSGEGATPTVAIGQAVETTSNVVFNDLTVSGTLTINGTTTTINSTITTLDDPIITLGGDTAPSSDDNKDRGVEFRWHNGSAAKVGFFGYDDSTGKLTFIPDATNTSEVFSGTLGTIDVGAVHINGSQIAASNLSNGTTGSGSIVLATSPTLTTPTIGVASATSINGLTITSSTGTLTIANGKTATVNNTLTFTGTDTSSVAFGTGGTVAYTANKLSAFAATSSSELAGVISDETGSGSLVFATSPTLVTPNLGTPSALTLTNATGLPVSGITASTVTALGVGSIELGHATDTTIARVSAGVVSIEGVNVVTISSTDTLTNKTLTSPTINTPTFTLATSSSTTDARLSWDTTNKKIQVGNGTISLDFPSSNVVTNAQTASYTLVLTDKDKLVEISNASANTLTIPLNSSVAFPVGTQITVLQTGAGQTTIAGAGGVTVNATPGLKLRAQWSSVTLIKRATDTWVALGDLQA